MSKRRKDMKEPETVDTSSKNKALFMAIVMLLAIVMASAVAAYYVYSSPSAGIETGDVSGGGDSGSGSSGESVPTVRNHMVIGELFVTTRCPYCAVAESDLKNLEESRGDFYFVTMVADVNEDAYNRYMEISKQQGTPDTEFDGGRRGELGAVDTTNYVNDIEYCKNSDVKDVRISGDASVVDSNHLSVRASVSVPGGTFNGHIRVFVIEKTSRYMNVNNEPIPNAFLGYAINEDLTTSSGNPYSRTVTWEGDYGDASNIAIIIAVYDSYGMGTNAYGIDL
jgi:hypothetical protein